jgi:hypothetical protein
MRTLTRFGLLFLLFMVVHSPFARGVQVAPADFSPDAFVQTFDDAGPENTVPSPMVLGDMTVTTSSGFIRVLDYLPGETAPSERCFGGSGTCVATGIEDLESISIEFETPVTQAGLWVGLTMDSFAASVSFFDDANTLLGAIGLSGAGGMQFAGWRADAGTIARITVQDTSLNNRVTVIDQAIYEPIPEPSTFALFATVCAAIGYRRRLV